LFTHFDVNVDELILKNVDLLSFAIHLAKSVFPVPGGPKSSKPFGGPLKPLKMSLFFFFKIKKKNTFKTEMEFFVFIYGLNIGQMTISLIVFF